MTNSSERYQPRDPLWYKDAVFYELRVRSFFDSDGDGIGDFVGLTRKLDYLYSLGVTTLWLLPFFPSPLRDDGYDISNYVDIHPECGSLHDFRNFLREAHSRGLHVVIELVLNHTSNQHQWFQRARRAPAGSSLRDYYIWSDTPERYKEARIIFQDFEPSNWAWDPVAKAYYFHRFYSHQPDLNYDSPAVRREILRVVDFWLGMGVDGLRLDAVPYLFKRDATSCENLPETHQFLRDLRRHIDANFANRMLLAEANQWPEDAVAYLAEGKECHMAFHFPLMPRMFMSVRREDRFPITDIWEQTPEIAPTCQWALFLRNHDELTLEMVSDEERDYMYRAFVKEPRMRLNLGIRRRLAPLLGNNRRTMELNNALLLSLPGTPVIYYGDEIGMGDNLSLGDRDGVRTPMQWNADRNAGFSTANPQHLVLPVVIDPEYHYQTVNVEAQEGNLHSLLWWVRRLIALRRQFQAFGRGSINFLNPENPRILAFIRQFEHEQILVIANLSRFVQYTELDLAKFKGMAPVELFGRTTFPKIGERPYPFTLGPHVFFWFSIEEQHGDAIGDLTDYQPPHVEVHRNLEGLLHGESRARLERSLPGYLLRCRWFRGKARSIRAARIIDSIPLTEVPDEIQLGLINVDYRNAESEIYTLPMALAVGEAAQALRAKFPGSVIAEIALTGQNGGLEGLEGVLYDAVAAPDFGRALFGAIQRRRRIKSPAGEFSAFPTGRLRALRGARGDDGCEPRLLVAEQSNSSIVFGDRFILKLFRRLDAGINPEVDLNRFLTERARFDHVPPMAGWIDFQLARSQPMNLAILLGYVANQGDAWSFTQSELRHYYEVVAANSEPPAAQPRVLDLLDMAQPDPRAANNIGAYLDAARLLGQRIAELHLALLKGGDDPEFAIESYSGLYQRSVYQSMRNQLEQIVRLVTGKMATLPEEVRNPAQEVLANQSQIIARFAGLLNRKLTVPRMRIHGDLHLGQLLYTGKDFVIVDFEGEPARALSERRRKRAALQDVAGMLRSFHYAALTGLLDLLAAGSLGKVGFQSLEPWATFWQTWSSWAFLRGYIDTARNSPLIPKDREEMRVALDAFMMEKAIYEVGYELNNRPERLSIPVHGILNLIGSGSAHP